jgi:signal peptidase I
LGLLAIICIYIFSRDRDALHTYPRQKYVGIDSFLDILFVLCIVFFIRLYLFSPFQIIGPSMESTFHGGNVIKNANGQYGDGEFILVDKMTYRLTTPKRGDVVVFSPRIGPEKKYLIKRVIGLPGDKIQIADKFVSIATSGNPDTFVKIDEAIYL